ncbi:hypothetical protein [Flavobacterium rhizosphaerae]|uniref:Uncharacterized protein n=1 Tax=Flavobacterium rhizosphaerae TaxID=3163298 RepID=A0ABW8YZG2_9FLAO
MDIRIALIGIFILLIIIVPLAIIHIKGENKEKIIINKLKSAAGNNGSPIEQYDLWNDYAISISTDKMLYYIKNKNEAATDIDLSQIAACRIINSGKEFNAIATNINAVNKLELLLTPKNSHKPISLTFFEEEANLYINEEIRLIKKWNEIINKNLQ